MRILLIGSGGREHALGRKIKLDDPKTELHCAPGNPGLADLGQCHLIESGNVEGLLDLACSLQPDLVLVGPEDPLTRGLANLLEENKIRVFGPDQTGAKLEASKSFAKGIMAEAGVPTGAFERFDNVDDAKNALKSWPQRVVIKADGLAAGKGVIVCETHEEAMNGLDELSSLDQPLIIEEMLEGPEISLFALVNGEQIIPLTTAQDHKRVGEGDVGPNTGGMGAYSPGVLSGGLTEEELVDIGVRPIAKTMCNRGTPFCGVLFVGFMLTPNGPKVLEYNVRFGDPECQVLMARMKSPLLPIINGLLSGETISPVWDDCAAMTVVLASAGYPGAYEKGELIELPDTIPSGAHLVHAGTALEDGMLVTSGGRVINAVGVGETLQDARAAVYELAKKVKWSGKFFRSDIGWQALK